MRPYTSFRYLYPPRPESVITSDRISYFEQQGWIGQYKKNGTCSIIAYSPQGEFIAMGRHNEPHRAWTLTQEHKNTFWKLWPKGEWTIVVAEILHNKTPTIKNTIYVHDILVAHSQYLVGETFRARQKLLTELLPASMGETESHYLVTENIWRVKNLEENLSDHFNNIKDPRINEGLVLKKVDSVLKFCDTPTSNSGWSVKVRYPTKNYIY
jgi:hypothetical protein